MQGRPHILSKMRALGYLATVGSLAVTLGGLGLANAEASSLLPRYIMRALDAQLDLLFAALALLETALLARAIPLCRALCVEGSFPAWRGVVLYNLGMTLVDWLCLPLLVPLVLVFWRLEVAIESIRSHEGEVNGALECSLPVSLSLVGTLS